MKTKKIYKALNEIKKYCDERDCSECAFHYDDCILKRLPVHWNMPNIKKALEKQ